MTVAADPANGFVLVDIIATDPIPESDGLTSPPFQFTIHIPEHITPGVYSLTADGATGPGHPVASDPVDVVVERPDTPRSLSVYPAELHLSPGYKALVSVTGRFADGAIVDLTKSTLTKYESNAPAVATFESAGIVRAIAPGSTTITVKNGRTRADVSVTVTKENSH